MQLTCLSEVTTHPAATGAEPERLLDRKNTITFSVSARHDSSTRMALASFWKRNDEEMLSPSPSPRGRWRMTNLLHNLSIKGWDTAILSKVLQSIRQPQQEFQQSIPHVRSSKPSGKEPIDPIETSTTIGNIKHLDGLRGIACLFVFNFHFLYPWTYTTLHGYGRNLDDTYLHQIPILCLFLRGRAMVALFFAISGYVLSYKTLTLAYSDRSKDGEILRTLSSSTSRRAIRLFGPPIVSMAAVAIAAHHGLFDRGQFVQQGEKNGMYWLTGSREEHPVPLATWAAQKQDFLAMLKTWTNPWTWDIYYSHYNPQTWTIPLEFRGSMILFVTLLATCRLRQVWRLMIASALVGYCLSWARWEVGLFLGGMVLVELDLLKQDSVSLHRPDQDVNEDESIQLDLPMAITLVAGLYLLSYPDLDAGRTPGFLLLASWTPKSFEFQYLHWHSLGGLLTLWSVNNMRTIRSLLESDLCQYLGKISFAFYLVHGPLLHSVGLPLMPEIWRLTGHLTNGEFVGGLLIGWVIMLALSILVADLFWMMVDMPCVKLTRRLETILLAH